MLHYRHFIACDNILFLKFLKPIAIKKKKNVKTLHLNKINVT